MSDESEEDWLRVVYGPGVGGAVQGSRVGTRSRGRGESRDITVRQNPPRLDPVNAPGGEQRVRVTVVPAERSQSWSLYLWDVGAGPGNPSTRRVWWRVEPGPWERLVGTRQCATGRGRARLDVELRVERGAGSDAAAPRLRFVAESIVDR